MRHTTANLIGKGDPSPIPKRIREQRRRDGNPNKVAIGDPRLGTIRVAEALCASGRLEASFKVLGWSRVELSARANVKYEIARKYATATTAWTPNEVAVDVARAVIEIVREADAYLNLPETVFDPCAPGADLTEQVDG